MSKKKQNKTSELSNKTTNSSLNFKKRKKPQSITSKSRDDKTETLRKNNVVKTKYKIKTC